MSEDIHYKNTQKNPHSNPEDAVNEALVLIEDKLIAISGKDCTYYGLPTPNRKLSERIGQRWKWDFQSKRLTNKVDRYFNSQVRWSLPGTDMEPGFIANLDSDKVLGVPNDVSLHATFHSKREG